MNIDYNHFKKKLEEERGELEEELSRVAYRNPDHPTDWIARSAEKDVSQADDNTVADSVEDYEENVAILKTLEKRYDDVLSALQRIEEKTYGLCQECQKEIEPKRLEANPAAETCKEHM